MSNAEMIQYWNESAGPVWVAQQERMDVQIAELGARTRERAAIQPGERVLDVGCGCGGTTLELAKAVGETGRVVAVDISRPMLARAKERAQAAGLGARIEWRLDDAQTAPLGDASFDVVFSRFGVMFFDDPVAAFANLLRALRPGGRFAFVCWQPREENPWMMAPARAAAQHIPFPPPPAPDAPGPFAFGDRDRVRGILEGAGFTDVAFEKINEPMRLAGNSVDETVEVFLDIGPVGAALRAANPTAEQRAKVIGAVREVIAGFQTERGIEAGSGVWIVTGRRAT